MKAEELGHYWKTSKTPPDTWLDRAEDLIVKHGGKVLARGFGSAGGREAYMLGFELEGDRFRIVWPVLESDDVRAARIQAATCLYHYVKQTLIAARVLGARTAFFSWLMLPDGRTACELSVPEMTNVLPDLRKALLPPGNRTGASAPD